MLTDRDDPMLDPVLDVCLEEVLGGKQPPDLSARILAALESRARGATSERDAGANPAPPRPIPLPIPLTVAPAKQGWVYEPGATPSSARNPARTSNRARTLSSGWLPLALAASVLLAASGYWLTRQANDLDGNLDRAVVPVAQDQGTQDKLASGNLTGGNLTGDNLTGDNLTGDNLTGDNLTGDNAASVKVGSQANDEQQRIAHVDAASGGVSEGGATPLPRPGGVQHQGADAPRSSDSPAPKVVASEPIDLPATRGPIETGTAETGTAETGPRTVASASSLTGVSTSAVTDAEVIAYIDRSLKTRWQEAAVRPSPAATESEWCRRVFLDLIGRIPTIQELESFLVDNSRAKRAKLVDRLLNSDAYAEAYARHWTTIWTTLLVGRMGGMEQGSLVNREGLQQYLRRSFLQNKPYDRMAYELVSAQGSNRPGDEDFNGAVNFILDNLQEKATPATAKTAQIFLGVQIQCTQCHGHPFNQWKQNRFWELNSFFRQAHAQREMQGNTLARARLVDEDFAGEGSSPTPEEAEVYYELRNGLMQVAYPVFIDGTELDRSGVVAEVDRRDELARLIVRSDEFAQAIVNRMWAHAFGYGFTKPIDDFGSHNPPSHPELLARLGREFAASGHDLKRLLGWITLSEAYSLSSKFGSKLGNAADDPSLGAAPLFSHFYLRQMTAEQLYDSLLVATEAHAAGSHGEGGAYERQQRTKDEWLKQFAIVFGTDENDEATTFDGTIPQTLMMMNGELTRQATSLTGGGFLSRVTQDPKAAPINQLYLAALGRRPTRAELQLANRLLAAQGGDPAPVLEDLWWALLNSNEFISNH